MAQAKTLSKSHFLDAPPEVRSLIYDELMTDPTASPGDIYQFFTQISHEISHETKRLISLFPTDEAASPKRISDWRLSKMDEELHSLVQLEINTIKSLEVNAELWAWDLDEELEGSEDAYIDDDGMKFWETHDDNADWIVEVLERFSGVENVELWSDGHGFMWDYALLIEQFELLKENEGRWCLIEPDKEERTFSLKFEQEDGNQDWRVRDRIVFIDVR